jgi:hypothetical protein
MRHLGLAIDQPLAASTSKDMMLVVEPDGAVLVNRQWWVGNGGPEYWGVEPDPVNVEKAVPRQVWPELRRHHDPNSVFAFNELSKRHRSHRCDTPVLDSNLDSHGIIESCRKAEVEVISGARWLTLRGPADHDKFLAIEAFDLAPQAAIERSRQCSRCFGLGDRGCDRGRSSQIVSAGPSSAQKYTASPSGRA